eukprot:403341334
MAASQKNKNWIMFYPLRQKREQLVQLTLLNINYCDGLINKFDTFFKYLTNVQILHYIRKDDNPKRKQIKQSELKQDLAIQQLDLRQVNDIQLYS